MNKENRLIEEEEMKTYITTFPVEVVAYASIYVEAVSEEEAMIKLDAMNREDMCEEMFHVVGGYVAGIPSGWEIEARHNMEEE
jgi:hypothetical protein